MAKILNSVILLFWAFFCLGQTLNTVFEKEEIEIGEPVRLTFSVVYEDASEEPVYTPHNSSITVKSENGERLELEILESFKDTIIHKEGQLIWKGYYNVTCWDSTYITLLPEVVNVGGQEMSFPPALLAVTMPPVNQNVELYDIYEQFTEVKPNANYTILWWVVSIAAVIIIAYFLYRFVIKQKTMTVPSLSLKELTLQQINELEESKRYDGHLKEYYADLSIILRRFIGAYYGFSALDKTSNEILALLKPKKLSREVLSEIQLILTKSDMVKFAKSTPPMSEVFEITAQARDVVNEITKNDSEE